MTVYNCSILLYYSKNQRRKRMLHLVPLYIHYTVFSGRSFVSFFSFLLPAHVTWMHHAKRDRLSDEQLMQHLVVVVNDHTSVALAPQSR